MEIELGLRLLGLLGCPTLCAAYSFLNREQSRATPVLLLRASDLVGQKSSSRSRSVVRTILLAQIACTRAGVPKRYVNTTQNNKIRKGVDRGKSDPTTMRITGIRHREFVFSIPSLRVGNPVYHSRTLFSHKGPSQSYMLARLEPIKVVRPSVSRRC